MKKIPLKKLQAKLVEGKDLASSIGVSFDCPSCSTPHQIEIPLPPSPRWKGVPVYWWCGSEIADLSVTPTILGEIVFPGCRFKGWIKLGRVEMLDLGSRPVHQWERIDDD